MYRTDEYMDPEGAGFATTKGAPIMQGHPRSPGRIHPQIWGAKHICMGLNTSKLEQGAALDLHKPEPYKTLKPKNSKVVTLKRPENPNRPDAKARWDFPKIRVPYFGVLLIRILLFRVLY